MEAQLEHIIDELKVLPREKWSQVAEFVHELNEQSEAEKWAILNEVFGSLQGEEAEHYLEALESCERIDE